MSSDRLQDVKNNGKSSNFRPKKWLWSLTGGGRLLSFTGVSNCKSLTGKILLFWIGGRLWEVVIH